MSPHHHLRVAVGGFRGIPGKTVSVGRIGPPMVVGYYAVALALLMGRSRLSPLFKSGATQPPAMYLRVFTMDDEGVYVRAEDASGKWASLDLIYDVSREQFLDWVGTKIAASGGMFAVDAELQKELSVDMRFELLHMLETNDLGVVYLPGGEYARQVSGRERRN